MNSTETEAKEQRSPLISVGSFRLPRLEHARVEDAMHPGVVSVAAKMSLQAVARMLSTRHIHSVVVENPLDVGAASRWGLISSSDLVRASVDGAPGSFEERTAGELALSAPPTVSSADRLEDAARLMARHGAQHLLVVKPQDGSPLGVLSTLDIAGVIAWGEV